MGRLEPVAGTEIVDDIRLGHTWYEYGVLKSFVSEHLNYEFVEIGVHEGGLVHLLLQDFPDLLYLGVELYEHLVRPEVKKQVVTSNYGTLIFQDCFHPDIIHNIQNTSPKIIYCDGGHKALELDHFKSACHSGDIIMCHDFWDGIRVPRDVPEGAWKPEVLWTDIEHLDSDKSFERLDEEIFKETRIVGWKKI